MSVVAEGLHLAHQVGSTERVRARSFSEFYSQEWPGVAGFCGALVGSQPVGDDLAQEAFTRLCTRWLVVREPRPYVFRIARNLAHRHHRHAATEVLVDALPERAAGDADAPDVLDAVRALPERLRVVVLLHYYADLPVAEVAASLRRPSGTVKRQLNEARTLLGQSLGDDHA